jgi:hypothetical protein
MRGAGGGAARLRLARVEGRRDRGGGCAPAPGGRGARCVGFWGREGIYINFTVNCDRSIARSTVHRGWGYFGPDGESGPIAG